jgi:hypothetical protein
VSKFEEVFDLKDNVLMKLIMDDALVNALLNQPVDAPIENRLDILYKNIFPYKKAISETLTEKTCFITMDYSAYGLSETKFKDASLVFYIIVHEDLMRMQLGKRTVLRTDYLAHKIDDIFNNTRGFGIGRLQFGGMKSVELPLGWEGLAIYYNTTDFN